MESSKEILVDEEIWDNLPEENSNKIELDFNYKNVDTQLMNKVLCVAYHPSTSTLWSGYQVTNFI